MKELNEQDHYEEFSDDPEENLRIENELLKLKMQAERGGTFYGGEDIPPEIENQWLQNIQLFEQEWDTGKTIKVYDFIGRPEFKPANTISDDEVKTELQRLNLLMAAKNVFLGVLGIYEPIVIYRFITEELFEHETEDICIPGWTKNFIYEEFHPNHKMDIEKSTDDFLRSWFENGFSEGSFELAMELATPDGKIFTRSEIVEKLNNCLSCYISFSEVDYVVNETKFTLNEDAPGLGHSQGSVSYKAQLESRETILVKNNFKFYMSNEYGFWEIFYFAFPGFAW
jgi:hypothetical protein